MKEKGFVVVAVLVAVVLAFGGFFVGSHTGIEINVNIEGAGNANTPATTAPATTAPTTAAPATTAAPTTTAAPADTTGGDTPTEAPADTTAAPSGDVLSTPEEIVAKLNEVVNASKHEAGTVTVRKVESINLNLDDCSISAATKLLNPIIQKFITDTDDTFVFTDGVATKDDGGTKELNSFFVPSGKDASLSPDAVANATWTDNGNGTYTIEVLLKAETSTFDGATGATVNPVNHESIMDPLNLATLDISPAKITSANMSYPGLELKATYNSNGTLDEIVENCKMSGTGSGGISVFNVDLTISGNCLDTWTFTR